MAAEEQVQFGLGLDDPLGRPAPASEIARSAIAAFDQDAGNESKIETSPSSSLNSRL